MDKIAPKVWMDSRRTRLDDGVCCIYPNLHLPSPDHGHDLASDADANADAELLVRRTNGAFLIERAPLDTELLALYASTHARSWLTRRRRVDTEFRVAQPDQVQAMSGQPQISVQVRSG
jgi:hypothetical protein